MVEIYDENGDLIVHSKYDEQIRDLKKQKNQIKKQIARVSKKKENSRLSQSLMKKINEEIAKYDGF